MSKARSLHVRWDGAKSAVTPSSLFPVSLQKAICAESPGSDSNRRPLPYHSRSESTAVLGRPPGKSGFALARAKPPANDLDRPGLRWTAQLKLMFPPRSLGSAA